LHRNRVEQVGQRQPDGADLLPAGRDAVGDPARDDEVTARVVVAERETEALVEQRGQRTPRERRGENRGREPSGARWYNHLFIL